MNSLETPVFLTDTHSACNVPLRRFHVIIQSSIFIADDSGYAVENYDESPGTYFENKGPAFLYSARWKTVKKISSITRPRCPEGSRKLRFPVYVTMAQDGGKVVSLTHRPLFTPRKYSWY